MKLHPRCLLGILILGLALTPAVSFAAYTPADRSLARLESIVTLTPDQKTQAFEIFQKLKDTMDAMPADAKPEQRGHSLQEARAAIRAILTLAQLEIYDHTPQNQGGGSMTPSPAIKALSAKIKAFTENIARTSPEIAAQVGTVAKVTQITGTTTTTNIVATTREDGRLIEATARPAGSGINTVRITGSTGTKVFEIYWTMDQAGGMSLTKIENKEG